LPVRQRSHGQVVFEVARQHQRTRPVRLFESGPSRVRLPNTFNSGLEAVIMNTGGGVACGDRFDISVTAGAGSDLVMTTPAAERFYRSDGPVAALDVTLAAGSGARLAWLPQESLIYNEARVRRRFDVDLAGDAELLTFECVVFGRAAKGEHVEAGLFEDRWRIRRDGLLVYADSLRLEGPIAALLQRPAVAAGARALATLLYAAPDAEARIDEVRDLLAGAFCEAAASAWNGLLVVRFLARDIACLRSVAMDFLTRFRGAPLPRVWHS